MKTLVCTLLSKNTLFLLCLLSISTSYGQVLTIESGGQTGTSGANWSISGNTLTVTGNASIRASVIVSHLTNTGPLTIVGNTTPSNLQVSVNEAISVSSGSNSLVIGASDNKGAITITQTITLPGSISFHGGWVRLENDVVTTGSGAKILAKANESTSPVNATDGFISLLSGKNLTTNGGDIILWANATNKTSGSANNEIILIGSNTLSTSGGKIVLAGGSDNGSNGGTASDGIPDGYAYRGSYTGRAVDIHSTVTLNSGGGEIIIRGEQNGGGAAVGADATFTISNGGAVTIEGKNTTATSVNLATANIASTATNAPVTISGTTHITNSGLTTISTQGGDVLLASNVDDATDGESVTNGYIRLGSGLSITTNGGDITIGGGDATGSGYALGSTASTAEGIRIDASVNLNSGNGNIALRGKSAAVAVATGVGGGAIMFYNVTNGSINSGTGTLLLDGYSQTTAGNAIAGLLWWNNPTASTFTIQSANTTTSAITLNGYSTSSTGQSHGLEVEATNTLNVYATGTGGGISINGGRSQSNIDPNEDRDIVFRGPVNILANSGPISIKGGQLGGVSNGYWFTGLQTQIGSAAAGVTSSASDITIAFDRFWFDANYFPKLATTGTVTIEPLSTGFGMGVSSAWFQYNQNGQTMTGLTLGKAGNTADINHEITAISAAGPISVYGGTLTLNTNLTTTNGGDVSLYTDNNLGGLSSTRTITADGAFKLIPNGTSFSNNISYPITNLNVISNGLTIGKSGNTANITMAQPQTIAGPITLYGGTLALDNNITCTNIELSGTATLANGKYISASGNMTNNGTLNLSASSSGYSQLKVGGAITNSGTISQSQYIGSTGHHGISSPMTDGFTTTSGTSSALYGYNASTGAWNMSPTTTSVGAGFFAPVQASNGFQSAVGGFSVTGTPNTIHTHTLGYSTLVAAGGSGEGWNLIGNPYTCGLDWTSGTVSKTNVNGAIYIWDASTSTYKYYVNGVIAPSNWGAPYGYAGTQLTSGVIAPMQAFWVQVTTNAPASIVSTMASDGTVASSPTFYKTAPDNLILYAEDLNDPSLSDAMWITHASGYTNDFEGDRDAWKRSNYGGQANIYSYHNGEKLAINATDLSSSASIPVGVKAPANGKKYKLVLEQIVNNQDYQVILEDKLFNSFTDISNQGYSFTSGLWQNEEPRFVLHVSQSTVGTEEDVASSIKAYQQGDRLIIQGNAQEHGRYSLVTLDGGQVAEGALQAGMANIEAPIAGVYILQITGAQSVAQRVIVQ